MTTSADNGADPGARTELENLRAEIDYWREISAVFNSPLSIRDIIRTSTSALRQIFASKCDTITILFFDARNRTLSFADGAGDFEPEVFDHPWRLNDGIMGHVVQTRTAFRTGNVSGVPFYKQISSHTVSELAAPIIDRSKRGESAPVLGVINMESSQPDAFSEADETRLEMFTDHLVTQVLKAQADEELRSTSYHLMELQKTSFSAKLLQLMTHDCKRVLREIQRHVASLVKQRGEAGDASAGEAGDYISQQIAQWRERVNLILERSSKPQPTHVAPTPPGNILHALVMLVESEVRHHEVELSVDEAGPELPLIDVDELQVTQALFSLVSNALDAMRGSAVKRLTLRAALTPEGEAVQFVITDTGCGIPEKLHRKVFEGFYSTKDTGTGIGLTLAREVIESYGGEIELTSQVGAGTTFVVRFPIHQPNADQPL